MPQRWFIRRLAVSICLTVVPLLSFADSFSGEKIFYNINPVGVSTFADQGIVDLGNIKVHKVIFHTQAMGLNDTETIYSDPATSLPLRVERQIKWLFKKEYIVEEYDQEHFTYTMTKFKQGKIVEKHSYAEDGPIHNAILLPFHLRNVKDLHIGWTLKVRVPQEFTVTLSSIDDIVVPAGKFKAYHFTSEPVKFEIWISQDDRRIPIEIKELSGLNYAMKMKKYIPSPMAEIKE